MQKKAIQCICLDKELSYKSIVLNAHLFLRDVFSFSSRFGDAASTVVSSAHGFVVQMSVRE